MQVLTTMPSGHHESQGSGYAQDSWININGYSQPPAPHSISPLHEYSGFDYGHSPPLPMESTFSMPRPPPYAAPGHHPLPPPLVMPQQNGVWPSMLTSSSPYQTPILPAGPIHTPVSAAPSHGSDMTPTSAKSTSRRKLTDEERRQMCLEAENNPTMKQTQIGAKFNVERSTVSKILRQKDKYMKPQPKEDVVTSPNSKKSKVKLPDFEKTLANWVRNQLKKGPVLDEELRKQAGLFSAGRNDQQHLSSPTWLEQFKQKYIENNPNELRNETPVEHSPTSSNGLVSPPMSTVDENAPGLPMHDQRDQSFDFTTQDVFDQSGMVHRDIANSIHPTSDSTLSPVSPDLGHGDGIAIAICDDEHVRNSNGTVRQRSQTFSHLPDVINLTAPTSSVQQNIPLPARPMTTAINTNMHGSSIDPRQMMKRHKSVPDIHDAEIARFSTMQPPPLPRSADISPVSNPGSPVSDDHMKALHMIKRMLEQRPDVAEPDDYVMIGKLMEKLKLLRGSSSTPILPAGMHAIDISGSPRISKKRTIIGISN